MTEDPAPVVRVLLVGMMGAGKSAVARVVAAELGCRRVDTDEMVERAQGMTVADLFSQKGEAAFRAAEYEALAQLVERPGPLVVSVGGGAVLKRENRVAMRSIGTVVWLRAQPSTLGARVGRGEGRPLLAQAGDGGPKEVLSRLAAERAPLYQEVADTIIDVDELSVRRVAELVVAELGPRQR